MRAEKRYLMFNDLWQLIWAYLVIAFLTFCIVSALTFNPSSSLPMPFLYSQPYIIALMMLLLLMELAGIFEYYAFSRFSHINVIFTNHALIFSRLSIFKPVLNEIDLSCIESCEPTHYMHPFGNVRVYVKHGTVIKGYLFSVAEPDRFMEYLNAGINNPNLTTDFYHSIWMPRKPSWLSPKKNEYMIYSEGKKARFNLVFNAKHFHFYIWILIISLDFITEAKKGNIEYSYLFLFALFLVACILTIVKQLRIRKYDYVSCYLTNRRFYYVANKLFSSLLMELTVTDIETVEKASYPDVYGNIRMYINDNGVRRKRMFSLENESMFIEKINPLIARNNETIDISANA